MRIQICLKPSQIIRSISDCAIHIAKDISDPINKLSINFLQLLIQHIYVTAKPGNIPSIRDQLLTIRALQPHRSNVKRQRIPFGWFWLKKNRKVIRKIFSYSMTRDTVPGSNPIRIAAGSIKAFVNPSRTKSTTGPSVQRANSGKIMQMIAINPSSKFFNRKPSHKIWTSMLMIT